ncbi:YncE family protein [Terriglobus sp. 2YAB30_2]|uniref:YncE family protein n=1 Tax=unclassified Terriglobus TaxID=2628988 RepID=UPI003F9B1B45
MFNTSNRALFLAFALPTLGSALAIAQGASSVKLIQSVDLPGYSGDFDHFAVDFDRNRLLLAAEDHGTLEVFDLKTSAHLKTVSGFGNPHSILVRKGANTVFITDSEKQGATIRDADSYAKKQSVSLTPGSDTSKYDASANTLYVVTGGKDVDMKTANLEAVNPDTGAKLGSITFQDNHVEAMSFSDGDPRLFINLTQTNTLAVVDRKAMKVLKVWPVPPAKQNAMVAFDPAQHRLYVVCRDPGMVVVMNSDTGAVVSTLSAPLRSDEVQYDATARRLYVPGGEGYMGIYDTSDPDHLKLVEKVKTEPGAKTGVLIPSLHRLFLAVSPGETKAMAKILAYETK